LKDIFFKRIKKQKTAKMDQREARKFTTTNPEVNYNGERRPSLIDRLIRRRTSSTSSDDMNMASALQRRGSIEQPEVPARPTTITQRVQQEMKKPVPPPGPRSNGPEFSIFT